MHVYIHTHTHVHVNTHIHMCTHTETHMYIHLHAHNTLKHNYVHGCRLTNKNSGKVCTIVRKCRNVNSLH